MMVCEVSTSLEMLCTGPICEQDWESLSSHKMSEITCRYHEAT
jgi:hypothetical protein